MRLNTLKRCSHTSYVSELALRVIVLAEQSRRIFKIGYLSSIYRGVSERGETEEEREEKQSD